MNQLTTITLILAIAAALAHFWLITRAFSKHIGWGLGVVLPPVAIVFGMRHWATERKPFLFYLFAILLASAAALYAFNSWGGWELLRATARFEHGMETQQVTVIDAEAYVDANNTFHNRSGLNPGNPQTLAYAQQLIELEEAKREAEILETRRAQAERDRQAQAGNNTEVTQANDGADSRFRLSYKTVPVSEARKYIGATVKVTRRNVEEKEYRLTGVTSKSLQFTQRNGSGAYSFAFRMSDIEKLRVLVQEPL